MEILRPTSNKSNTTQSTSKHEACSPKLVGLLNPCPWHAGRAFKSSQGTQAYTSDVSDVPKEGNRPVFCPHYRKARKHSCGTRHRDVCRSTSLSSFLAQEGELKLPFSISYSFLPQKDSTTSVMKTQCNMKEIRDVLDGFGAPPAPDETCRRLLGAYGACRHAIQTQLCSNLVRSCRP